MPSLFHRELNESYYNMSHSTLTVLKQFNNRLKILFMIYKEYINSSPIFLCFNGLQRSLYGRICMW